MRKREINIGDRFGKLTILMELKTKNWIRVFKCKCDCGNEKDIKLHYLTMGDTKSCGCLKVETVLKIQNTTHGLTQSTEFNSWKSMKARCYNPKATGYENYGGRGITVCERWLNSFENFYSDMGKKPDKTYSLDRIDNDMGYYPENCKWSSNYEQTHNRRKFKHKKNRIPVEN